MNPAKELTALVCRITKFFKWTKNISMPWTLSNRSKLKIIMLKPIKSTLLLANIKTVAVANIKTAMLLWKDFSCLLTWSASCTLADELFWCFHHHVAVEWLTIRPYLPVYQTLPTVPSPNQTAKLLRRICVNPKRKELDRNHNESNPQKVIANVYKSN